MQTKDHGGANRFSRVWATRQQEMGKWLPEVTKVETTKHKELVQKDARTGLKNLKTHRQSSIEYTV